MPGSQTRQLLDTLNAVFPRLGTEVTDATQARRLFAELLARSVDSPTVDAATDEVLRLPDGRHLPVRVYQPPRSGANSATPAAVVVFLHGGGWVLGGLDSHDSLARRLCRGLEAAVVSIDYPLSPEHPYPAALDATVAAVRLIAQGVLGRPPARLVLAGDSAGGNLAAAACLHIRDEGADPSIAAQLLCYPVLAQACSSPSYTENGNGNYITRDHLTWFWSQYLHGVDRPADHYASPGEAADLSDLPPAVIVTAGLDPLRDEGVEYGRRLAEARVPVRQLVYVDAFHGFLGFAGRLDVADRAIAELCAATRELVSG